MFNNLTPVVKNLLLANVLIFALSGLIRIDLVDIMGLRYALADEFAPHQLITYMFMHGGWGHLFSNMFALFIFGPLLERFWGPKKFFLFYMITGIGAGILYGMVNFYEVRQVQTAAERYMESPDYESFTAFMAEHASGYYASIYDFIDDFGNNQNNERYVEQSKAYVSQIYQQISNVPMVGASGAVFGILMAFGLLFPNTELMLLIPPMPVKAKYLVTFYGLYELYSGVQRSPGDNVAHWAHLGGMLIAYILIRLWRNQRNTFY